jgi:hypothetical protein
MGQDNREDKLLPPILETNDRRQFIALAAAMAFPINLQKDQHHAVINTLRQANELADAVFGVDSYKPKNGLPFTEVKVDDDTVIREPSR